MENISINIDGNQFSLNMKPKTFKTGSKGFYVWGKATDKLGKKYQISGNIVEIGSKNKEKTPAKL